VFKGIKYLWHGICYHKNILKKTFVQYCGLKNLWYNVDIRSKREEKEKKMKNLKVFNTMSELVSFLSDNAPATIVNDVAFGMDLLDYARDNDNEIEIGNDGGFIRIDDMGYVVADFAIC
jgi:hypothetical protein